MARPKCDSCPSKNRGDKKMKAMKLFQIGRQTVSTSSPFDPLQKRMALEKLPLLPLF
jgi:hypothetical protein